MDQNFENYFKEEFKNKIMSKDPIIEYYNIHWNLFKECLDELGYKEYYYDSNGWEHDVWMKAWKPGTDYYYEISCSWYYPATTFTISNNQDILKLIKNGIF